MRRIFEIYERKGRHGLDIIIESRVTGEVFFILLDSHDPEFPVSSELVKMVRHIGEVRRWAKDGVIEFAGDQVLYNRVYC